MAEYPEIEALNRSIKEHNLELEVEPLSPEFEAISYQRIRLKHTSGNLSIPVEDEYGDAENPTQLMLLQLVVMNCEYYEEGEDILEWSRWLGLNASEPLTLSIYRELGEVVPKIRAIVGDNLKSISSFEWELNSGAAQALRKPSPQP